MTTNSTDSEPLSALIRDVHILGEAELVSFERVAARAQALREDGRLDEALQLVREWLTHYPLSHRGFQLLGDLYETANRLGESVVAYERALQVDSINLQKEPSPGPWNIRDRITYKQFPERALELNGQIFPRLLTAGTPNRPLLIARNLEGTVFLRIDLTPGGARAAGWQHEQSILEHLHATAKRSRHAPLPRSRTCQSADAPGLEREPSAFLANAASGEGALSAPAAYGVGRLAAAQVRAALAQDDALLARLPEGVDDFPYALTGFLRRDPTPTYGDIALSLFEQRALGVYIGKLDSRDLRYDADSGICALVDYTRARLIPEEVQALRGRAYLDWVRAQEEQRLPQMEGQERPQHFMFGGLHGGKPNAQFESAFSEGRLNLQHAHGKVIDSSGFCANELRFAELQEDLLEVSE